MRDEISQIRGRDKKLRPSGKYCGTSCVGDKGERVFGLQAGNTYKYIVSIEGVFGLQAGNGCLGVPALGSGSYIRA